jgi:hypothetical protein
MQYRTTQHTSDPIKLNGSPPFVDSDPTPAQEADCGDPIHICAPLMLVICGWFEDRLQKSIMAATGGER